ncbi:glycine betaine/proline transport system permease protein [Desulfacinum infernum DSM 9756]|uniref:Glycine betaine/proline transport system permease protein n=1 Tax=Desulfacinum infernum DSM 9756 TaxID=1121391 RepID=A0A1M5ETH0_9BACT|nr:proline/glycine betaine ABC transporter permease [Desulfacinum infernum]SHF82426.1 glycine betaine/proline transport system permease protein [Desulfacinum infernum DSM 9756]
MMSSLLDVLTTKIPLGEGVAWMVDFFTTRFSSEFRALSQGVESAIGALEWCLGAVHPLVLIALFAVLAWVVRRSKAVVVFCLAGFALILNLGLWEAMIQTLALIATATVLCLALGIPWGIVTAHNRTAHLITRPILDLMQTIPAFVYLIPALMFFGLGAVPGVFATVVFAMPPVIRLTCLGIQQVPTERIEAGKAFGASPWQLLVKIEFPSAMPSILMGINQTIMLALSMVVIAALIGAEGLGGAVMRSLAIVDVGMGFESGLGIVVLAMLLDRIVRSEGTGGRA